MNFFDNLSNGVMCFIVIVSMVLFLVISVKLVSLSKPKNTDKGFIYWQDFMDDWIIDKKTKQGYFYNHSAGCYVILIFNKFVKNGNFSNYENVYVGQSIWVENRVHNHFIGKGNGDVYADVKYGKKVYVKIIYCPREKMNDIEKKLIEKYDATSSYNGTSGGSTNWVVKNERKGK